MTLLSSVFASRLKRLRRLKKITQEELAAESGLDRTFISLLERGLRSPSLSSIEKIALSLNMSLTTLISTLQQTEIPDDINLVDIDPDIDLSLIEHMLNGMAYCKMHYIGSQPCDFTYLYTNATFEELTGLKNVIGKCASEVIPGIESEQLLLDIYGRVANGGSPEKHEIYITSLKMWFYISVYSTKKGYFVSIFDVITERKLIEQKLQSTAERLTLAQRAALAGTWDWDILSGEITWSDSLYDIFNLDPTKLEAGYEKWLSLLHPDDKKIADDQVAFALSNKVHLAQEYRILTSTGEIRWIEALGNTIFDANNDPIRMIGICLDITDRKNIDNNYLQNMSMFDETQKIAHVGSWDWNIISGHVRWTKEAALIYVPDNVETQPSFDAFLQSIHVDDLKVVTTAIENTIKHNAAYDLVHRVNSKSKGVRYVHAKGEIFKDFNGDPKRLVGTVQDITDRKLADIEICKLLEQQRAILESTDLAIITTDNYGLITSFNPASEKILGYKKDEVIGKMTPLEFHDFYEINERAQDFNLRFNNDISPNFELFKFNISKIGYSKKEWTYIRKDGLRVPVELYLSQLKNSEGEILGYLGIAEDLSEKKRAEVEILEKANYDHLTHLPNRRYFQEHLAKEINKSEITNKITALLIIDLDHFKDINDSLGHFVGDSLLIESANRIKSCLTNNNTLARLGGDEFAVSISNFNDLMEIERIAQQIIIRTGEPYVIDGKTCYLSASIGISIYPEDARNALDLIKGADQAMYKAKSNGRNRFNYFTKSMQVASDLRLQLAVDLRQAVTSNELELYFQPIVEMSTNCIYKAEALLRWHHPVHGFVSPSIFIPIAEETGSIHEIGDWVFYQATKQAKELFNSLGRKIQISINKSPVQFKRSNTLTSKWINHLRSIELPDSSIVIEITESLLIDNDKNIKDNFIKLRESGIKVAIDDFGTGYSALSYLKMFDIDYLKIDKSFINEIFDDGADLAVCEAIIVMAHKLGLKVIAEGVETALQRDLLKKINCDYAQGFFYSKAISAEEFKNLLNLETSTMKSKLKYLL